MDFNIIYWIILMISMAELAIQIVVSELSYKVKDILGMHIPNKRLDALCSYQFWAYFIGYIAFIPQVAFIVYRFFIQLLNCPYCTGFWLGLGVNLFVLNMLLPQALLLAPICLVFVAVLDKIHS